MRKNREMMDSDKVAIVNNWKLPESIFHVWSFVGFVIFYRGFIKNFFNLLRPLIMLRSKGDNFSWSDECLQAFE